ncbi:serine beta-lactamase-like protein LACTB, mitochondrial [Argonauta hians]
MLVYSRLCCLKSFQRVQNISRRCYPRQYPNSFHRFQSTFRKDQISSNLHRIFKNPLFRLGVSSATVLLVGCYLYDGGGRVNDAGGGVAGVSVGGGPKQTLPAIAECRQTPPVSQRTVKLNSSEKLTLEEAIAAATELTECRKTECSAPGLVIAVSIDGELVWSEGFGYADLENRIPFQPDTVCRIASISKSLTMAAVAKMWENGLLDLDKPVQHYVPSFPEKEVDGEKVVLTVRHLLCHMSGIRHYDRMYMNKKTTTDKPSDKNGNENANRNENTTTFNNTSSSTKANANSPATPKTNTTTNATATSAASNNNNNNTNNNNNNNNNTNSNNKNIKQAEGSNNTDYKMEEMYLKKSFKDVDEALTLFKDDPLVHKPGSKFLYTTHGWTLVSAVLEKSSNVSLTKMMPTVFRDLGLHNTYLDRNKPIIYNRSRFYSVSKNGQLVNAPYVDNSYKWAGGGFLSTAEDLIKFGNAMLYSFQFNDDSSSSPSLLGASTEGKEQEQSQNGQTADKTETGTKLKGYLKRQTMLNLWKPSEGAKVSEASDIYYGLGWELVPYKQEHAYCLKNRFYTFHSGNAIGASSILLILPQDVFETVPNPPKGVVVSAICNIGDVGLRKLALSVADVFDRVKLSKAGEEEEKEKR